MSTGHQSGMGCPDWYMSVFDSHLQRLLWMYYPGHAMVKENDLSDRLTLQVAFVSEALEC